MSTFEIYFLGTRGSLPVSGEEFDYYGGATSCVLLKIADKIIILDCGTGILSADKLILDKSDVNILISHPHIDHIMGLPMFPLMFDKSRNVNIISSHITGDIKAQIDYLMAKPLWPVSTEIFASNVSYFNFKDEFYIGDIKISSMSGAHPDGCSVYRIDYDGKSVVYATDYEINDNTRSNLVEFSKNCDVFICDGQYSLEEMTLKAGFGHSSYIDALHTGKMCGAKKTVIFHHSPFNNDEKLKKLEENMKKYDENSEFAKKGGVISI